MADCKTKDAVGEGEKKCYIQQEQHERSQNVPVKSGTKRQFYVSITVTVALALVLGVVMAILVSEPNKKIESIETELIPKLQSTLKDTIMKLERRFNDTQVKNEEELKSALEKIEVLEQQLNSTEAKTAILESSYEQLSIILTQKIKELNATKTRVKDLEENRIATLEMELNRAELAIASLNATKASKMEVTEVLDLITELNTEKVDRSEFEMASQLLRENISRAEGILQEKISDVNDTLIMSAAMQHEELNNTKNRVESIYLELTMEVRVIGKESSNTISLLQVTIEELANTTSKTENTEVRVNEVESDIVSLNTTKASMDTVDELIHQVAKLDEEKADKTELVVLLVNLTSLEATQGRLSELETELGDIREELNVTEEELDNARAKVAQFEQQLNITNIKTSTLEISHQELSSNLGLIGQELNTTTLAVQDTLQDLQGLQESLTNITTRTETLEMTINYVESDIASLNVTKASTETVNDQVSQLDMKKVEKTEFAVVLTNLSVLSQASYRADEEIQQELSELAGSTLNQTYFNQLQQAIASKASQTDLEALASSTVRTETFLQRVENIQNTILQLQWNITLNFTYLEGRIQHLNLTLSTKPNQADIAMLSNTVTSLEGSTVHVTTFQEFMNTVQSSKANKTDLSQLQRRVDTLLEGQTATKIELSTLKKEQKDHSSESDEVHSNLSSRISSNTDRISDLEARQSSSSGLAASQLVTTMSVTLAIIQASRYTDIMYMLCFFISLY